MAIDWIPVQERLPTNRKSVLVARESLPWGRCSVAIDKYNPGDKFDCERNNVIWCMLKVTHWAEVNFP